MKVKIYWEFSGDHREITLEDGTKIYINNYSDSKPKLVPISILRELRQNIYPGDQKRHEPSAPYSAGSAWEYEVDLCDKDVEILRLYKAALDYDLSAVDKLHAIGLIDDMDLKNAHFTYNEEEKK